MGLVRIDNPRKLRALSARVGRPVIRAYSRWFENQNDLLAFTDATTAYLVPKSGDVEPYADYRLELLPNGVRSCRKASE